MYILYIYFSLCALFLSLSFALALFLTFSVYKFTFSMKIILSAAYFVALVRHSSGDIAPEITGNRTTRTGCLRVGYRPINTRTGSPVPAT